MHRAIGDTTKLVNHAVIPAGHAAGAVAQLGAPAAPQFWTLQSEPDRLLGQSKRDGRQADVELIGSSRTTFIKIYLALGDVSDHHMTGQSASMMAFTSSSGVGGMCQKKSVAVLPEPILSTRVSSGWLPPVRATRVTSLPTCNMVRFSFIRQTPHRPVRQPAPS